MSIVLHDQETPSTVPQMQSTPCDEHCDCDSTYDPPLATPHGTYKLNPVKCAFWGGLTAFWVAFGIYIVDLAVN